MQVKINLIVQKTVKLWSHCFLKIKSLYECQYKQIIMRLEGPIRLRNREGFVALPQKISLCIRDKAFGSRHFGSPWWEKIRQSVWILEPKKTDFTWLISTVLPIKTCDVWTLFGSKFNTIFRRLTQLVSPRRTKNVLKPRPLFLKAN